MVENQTSDGRTQVNQDFGGRIQIPSDVLEEMFMEDSGNRTCFETGAVRDIQTGKGRYDLLPWQAIHQVAIHCERGAIKYGERNVDKGIPIHSLVDSAIRHLSRYLQAENDENHLAAAAWNVLWAIWMEKEKPEMQDIPFRAPGNSLY